MKRKKGISVSASAEPPRPLDALDNSDVCAFLDISDRQLRNLINSGVLPCEGKGKTRIFRWHEVLPAWVEYKISLAYRDGNTGNEPAEDDEPISGSRRKPKEDIRGANLRKTTADANLRELTLAQKQRQLVTIADAKERLERLMGNLRTRIMGAAPKLVSRFEAERDRPARQAAVDEELRALCFDLSSGSVMGDVAGPETLDQETDDASAEDES